MTQAAIAPAQDDIEPDVAGILEELRLAEARLARRRERQTSLSATDRAAMRYLLERVDSEEVSPSMIARSLHLTPAAGTALLDRLVERGMVLVEPHPRDRRRKLVFPFDRSVDPDHLDPRTSKLRSLAAALSPQEARTIASFLSDVLRAVGGRSASTSTTDLDAE